MKIEKISDNQIKFILNEVDLQERNINIKELAYGSEKTQGLFREMMEQAVEEFDFQAENAPLMIEAIPVSSNSIMIIVTKISTSEDIESRFNLFPHSRDLRKYGEKSSAGRTKVEDGTILIFSFNSLDEVSNASSRLFGYFTGSSFLYKDQNKYFLVVENDSLDDSLKTSDIAVILSEYGQKHISTNMSKQYLVEHAEIIIKKSAVSIMASI